MKWNSSGGCLLFAPLPSGAHCYTYNTLYSDNSYSPKWVSLRVSYSLSYICLFLNFCDPEAKLGRYYDDYSPLRLSIHSLCTSHHLDLFITFIICVNVFTMSIEHYKQPVVMRALTNLLKWKMLWKMSQINLYASPYIQSVHSVFRRGSEVL